MPFSIKTFILLICSCILLSACKSIRGKSKADLHTFTDYQTVETWIKENYKAETIIPESTLIKKIQYYPTSDNGYLIFKLYNEETPTLIYQNINPNLWNSFKNAASKGKFYNNEIHGNQTFKLELKNLTP